MSMLPMRVTTYMPTPTTAYVAYHSPPSFGFAGGKNGAVINARHKAMRRIIPGIQAMNGRLRSGRLYRSQIKPVDTASAKNWPGYPSTSRMNE